MASEVTAITDHEEKICRQIEYYLGDRNLPRDRFLQNCLDGDGWVDISLLTYFDRLGALSTDLAEIAAALDKSTSGLLQVNTDKTKVRRSPERPILERIRQLTIRMLMIAKVTAGSNPEPME